MSIIESAQNTLSREEAKLELVSQSLRNDISNFDKSENLDEAIDKLEKRKDLWQEKNNAYTAVDKSIFELKSKKTNESSQLEIFENSKARVSHELEQILKDLDLVQNRRKEIYGDKNPEIEEEKLTSNLNSLISKKNLSLENQSGLEKSVTELSTKKESLEKNITEKTTTLDAELKSFSLLLERNDFTSELNYLEARLEPSKKDELLSLETEIENTLKELQIKKNDRASSISLEKEKTLTDLSMDELLSNQKIDLEASESLTEQVALEKARLEENSKALSRLGEKQGLITRQKKNEKWSKLHSLIGSADGKKYRKYAQGLTFKIMVSHANKQLQKMTDRYLLIRDEKEPLSLNIMDNYQAGEIRSTKNLSGGEFYN